METTIPKTQILAAVNRDILKSSLIRSKDNVSPLLVSGATFTLTVINVYYDRPSLAVIRKRYLIFSYNSRYRSKLLVQCLYIFLGTAKSIFLSHLVPAYAGKLLKIFLLLAHIFVIRSILRELF